MFRRDDPAEPYVPPEGRFSEDVDLQLPSPYGPAGSRTRQNLDGHIVPGYHEPDRPERR